jgi:predicted AlkP superfamily pyrophosphatase or phosphodiesterase
MKKIKVLYKPLLSVVLLSVLFFSFRENNSIQFLSNKKYQTEYVIVLVIDGPRLTETFGDPAHQYIPNLANVLCPQGVLVPYFRNEGPTYTNAGHTAITTGNYQRINNMGLEFPKKPSMFQYFLKEKQLDSTQAWVITSKGKLSILANTKDKKWHNQFTPSQFCGINGVGFGYENDAKTWMNAQLILAKYHPKLSLINLLEVDVRGHQNEWPEYLQAIKKTDKIALELWDFIQSDSIYKNKTTLFITNDHGRHTEGHKNGFVNHGDKCEGCRSIYLVALGPDFKKNVILKNRYEQVDISKTISEMLHFDFPVSEGEIMTELFN